MFAQLYAIGRNTFFESIRQPIVLVVLVVVNILLVLSNPLAAFTMESDQRMMIDMGMATVFLAGCLLAAFVATGVLTREIENRTSLTVVSKPVARPVFVIGKYLGTAAALVLCTLEMAFAFLLVEMHTVLETVREPIHLPVITFGCLAVIIGAGVAIWCNYFYEKVFASTAIAVTTPLLLIAYIFSMLFAPDFSPQPMSTAARPDLWLGLVVMTTAIMVLTAIAIAASARLGQVMTLMVTFGAFLLGLLSDWMIGRRIRAIEAGWLDAARTQGLTESTERYREYVLSSGEIQRSFHPETIEVATVPLTSMAQGFELVTYYAWWAIYSVVPNMQVLWLSDALTQSRAIPLSYVATSIAYAACYVVAALAIGIALFQRREVG